MNKKDSKVAKDNSKKADNSYMPVSCIRNSTYARARKNIFVLIAFDVRHNNTVTRAKLETFLDVTYRFRITYSAKYLSHIIMQLKFETIQALIN